VAAAGVMSPWAIRNYRVFGKPIVTTTHGGYTFLLSNNISFYEHLRYPMTSLPWQPHALFWLGGADDPFADPPPRDELATDRRQYEHAWKAIRADKLRFLHSCAYRLVQLWLP